MVERIKARKERVNIAVVGKYIKLHDAYLSVAEALRHGGYENGCKVEIKWIEAEDVTDETAESILSDVVRRSWCREVSEIVALRARSLLRRYARDSQDPVLWHLSWNADRRHRICQKRTGYHWMRIPANSLEDCPHKVIDFMPDQYGDIPKGGTMRSGRLSVHDRKGNHSGAGIWNDFHFGTPQTPV